MAATQRTERETKGNASVAAASSSQSSTSDRELVIERFFDAPRELVWKAWTDARHVDKWWGPNGFRNETFSMDFRVGGTWRYVMHGPDGKDWPNWVRYEEISKAERLVYAHGGEGDEPLFHVTVTFSDEGKGTRVVMRQLWPSAEAVAAARKFGAVEGGHQTLARLAGFLPHFIEGTADRSMIVTRVFDAPVKLVWDAWTSPQMLSRWWGPKGFTTPIVEVDFRVGGKYRMVMKDSMGNEYPFHGEYKEIVPHQRIVFNAVIASMPGNDILTTVSFEEENGKTRLTFRQDIPAMKEAAKGQMQGASEQLEKLAAVLAAA